MCINFAKEKFGNSQKSLEQTAKKLMFPYPKKAIVPYSSTGITKN